LKVQGLKNKAKQFVVLLLMIVLKIIFPILEIIRLETIGVLFQIAVLRARGVKVGDGTVIQRNVIMRRYECISIGRNVSINAFVHIWGGGSVSRAL